MLDRRNFLKCFGLCGFIPFLPKQEKEPLICCEGPAEVKDVYVNGKHIDRDQWQQSRKHGWTGLWIMHSARLDKSDRLQRVYTLLQSGPQTTRDIVMKAEVMAVSACISELRQQGIDIRCEPLRKGIYLYSLERLF